MHRLAIITILAALLVVCAFQPVAGATYSVRSLGIAPGYDGSWATDINDNGIAICASMSITDTTGVFLWSYSGGFTNLSGQGIQAGSGINNQGQTGGLRKDEATGYYRPYIRNADGTTRDLSLPVGVADAWSVALNDFGRIVVDTNYRNAEGTVTETRTAIIGDDGSTAFVEYPNGYTSARAISNNGTIVAGGYMWTESGGLRALPWLTGNVDVRAVNDLGWVVGISNGHVLRWDSTGNLSDLGLGEAFGINNLGQVVGSIDNHAVVWDTSHSMMQLSYLDGYSSSAAHAINNMGQVVGEGTAANGQRIALLWEPVPEPSSFLALFGGLFGMGGFAWRRRKS